jgi:hypothetical protein
MKQVYLIWYLKADKVTYGVDSCATTFTVAIKKCEEKNNNSDGTIYSAGNIPIALFEED